MRRPSPGNILLQNHVFYISHLQHHSKFQFEITRTRDFVLYKYLLVFLSGGVFFSSLSSLLFFVFLSFFFFYEILKLADSVLQNSREG